ncbi:hypothetical protein [Albirhodobacter sp. R86504]|uniref:hypothetical protein n=1 Tax=Albirhodobacter sp. R86504 TaxID=3093848 RepID=UPI00366D9225
MAKHEPLFAAEKTAASLLDMRPHEFRSLVNAGALPRPIRIGEVERWRVDQLKAIATGEAMDTQITW